MANVFAVQHLDAHCPND